MLGRAGDRCWLRQSIKSGQCGKRLCSSRVKLKSLRIKGYDSGAVCGDGFKTGCIIIKSGIFLAFERTDSTVYVSLYEFINCQQEDRPITPPRSIQVGTSVISLYCRFCGLIGCCGRSI